MQEHLKFYLVVQKKNSFISQLPLLPVVLILAHRQLFMVLQRLKTLLFLQEKVKQACKSTHSTT